MAFDLLSQLRGPDVDINLFPQTASAGINAGNALPTPLTSAIKGAITGVSQGLSIEAQAQENEIRQHQIDRQPEADRAQEQALVNQDQINQINALKLDTAQKNHALELQVQDSELKQKNAEATQALEDFTNKKEISALLAANDAGKARSILSNPKLLQTVLNSSADYMNKVFGGLSPYMSQQEKDAAFKQLDFKRSMELDAAASRVKTSIRDKEAQQIQKTIEDTTTNPALTTLRNEFGLSLEQLANKNIKTYPTGTKTYVDGMLDAKAEDIPLIAPPTGYDVVVDGKKAGIVLDKTSADILNTWQLQAGQFNLVGALPTKAAPAAAPAANTPAPRPFLDRLLGSFSGGEPATPPSNLPATAPVTQAPIPAGTNLNIQSSDPITQQAERDLRLKAQADPRVRDRLIAKGLLAAPATPLPQQTPPEIPAIEPTGGSGFGGGAGGQEPQLSKDLKQNVAEVHSALPAPVKRYVDQGVMNKVLDEPMLKGLPPLYQAVAAVESGGNKHIKSPTGPKGFFQLTKSAAKEMGVNRDIPEQNIKGGISYLNKLLTKYSGNETAALMAYNIGPSVIDSAIDTVQSKDYSDIVFGLNYLKDRGYYKELLTDKKIKETSKYPLQVMAYKEAFNNLSYA